MARVTAGIVAAGVGGVALVILLFRLSDERVGPPIVISDPRPDATVVVAVGGAVATPGVYALPGDARVQDALLAAGGTTADADLAALNPAQRLRDEARVMVPARSPAPPPLPTPAPGALPRPLVPDAVDPLAAPLPVAASPINVNRATATDLDALPGIGPALAQRIVEHRAANGAFATLDALADVRGISPRMVDDLRPLATAGP